MKYSRRFLLWLAGASSCCLTTLVCTISFSQAPSTQPSAPNTQSTANPGGPGNAGQSNSGNATTRSPSSIPSSNLHSSGANTTGAQQGGASAEASNNSVGANTQGSAGNPGTTSQAGPMSGGVMGGDAGLAAWLIVDNEGEIAVSEIGRQKAQDPAVKEFAERMIQEHNQMLTKLRPIAGNMNASDMNGGGRRLNSVQTGSQQVGTQQPANQRAIGLQPGALQSANTQRAAQQQQGRQQAGGTEPPSATSNAVGAGANARFTGDASQQISMGSPSAISLKRELGAQCLQSKQQELSEKQGAEFDKCFMGMQVAMHMEVADTLKVFQKHASGQLRQSLDEALQTTQAHLEHAKQVQKSVEEKAKNDRAGGSANK